MRWLRRLKRGAALGQVPVDPGSPERPLVQERGVALYQGGPGVQTVLDVLGGLDAADGDQRQRCRRWPPSGGAAPPVTAASAAPRTDRRHRRPRPCPGAAVEPARAIVVLVAMMPSRFRSSARRATSSMSSSVRSGAILTSSGTCRPAALSASSPTARQQRPEGLDVLEQPEPGRVGRTDVDHEVVRDRRQAAGADEVVGHGVVKLHDLGLADVDADHGADVGCRRCRAARADFSRGARQRRRRC